MWLLSVCILSFIHQHALCRLLIGMVMDGTKYPLCTDKIKHTQNVLPKPNHIYLILLFDMTKDTLFIMLTVPIEETTIF